MEYTTRDPRFGITATEVVDEQPQLHTALISLVGFLDDIERQVVHVEARLFGQKDDTCQPVCPTDTVGGATNYANHAVRRISEKLASIANRIG